MSARNRRSSVEWPPASSRSSSSAGAPHRPGPRSSPRRPASTDRRAGPTAHRRVDRSFEPHHRDPGTGKIDHRARRRRAPEPVHRHDIGRSEPIGGVDEERAFRTAADPRHRELDDVRSGTVETMEASRRFVTDGAVGPKQSSPLIWRRSIDSRRSSDAEHTRATFTSQPSESIVRQWWRLTPSRASCADEISPCCWAADAMTAATSEPPMSPMGVASKPIRNH